VPTSDDRPDAPLEGPPDLLRDRERLRALLDYRASAPLSDPGLDVDRLMERLSRELRTPLNAVLGFAQLLRLDVSEGDRQAAVDEILRAGGELQVVLARLVGAAEAPAPLAAPPEPVDLRRTTRGAVLHVASTAGAGQVDVREDPASGPEVLVSADQDLLDAVVLEAVQAGVRRTGSTLSWSCASEQGRAVLTLVADAPPGRVSPRRRRSSAWPSHGGWPRCSAAACPWLRAPAASAPSCSTCRAAGRRPSAAHLRRPTCRCCTSRTTRPTSGSSSDCSSAAR
jgi:hypothetical protein